MDNQYHQKVMNTNNLFDKRFLDTKILYLYSFHTLPSLHFINQVDGEKAFSAFKGKFAELIDTIHQYQWYKNKRTKFQFDRTVLILKNNCLVEFGADYCEMLHDGKQPGFIEEITALVVKFMDRQKKRPLEINLVVESSGYMELKTMEIKRMKLDLGLYYEDDFKEIDEVITIRLNKKKRQRNIVTPWPPRLRENNIPALPDRQNKKAGIISVALCSRQINEPRFHRIADRQPQYSVGY